MKEPYDFEPLFKITIWILAMIGLLTLTCPNARHVLIHSYADYSSEGRDY